MNVINYRLGSRGKMGGENLYMHLMPESMVRRVDILLTALFNNSYGIINLLKWE